MGRKRKMRGSLASLGIFVCLLSSALSEAQERAGRIFYVTTTTSVSTVNTVSFCHFLSVTDTAIVTCAARKRRMLRLNDQPSDAPSEEIRPSVSDIESSQEDMEDTRQGGLSTTGSPPPSPAPPPPSHPPGLWDPSCV